MLILILYNAFLLLTCLLMLQIHIFQPPKVNGNNNGGRLGCRNLNNLYAGK